MSDDEDHGWRGFGLEGGLAGLREQVEAWCRDRSWEARVPILLMLAWVLGHHFFAYIEYQNFFFAGLNLGIHEAGHFVFRPFGLFMTIAGGSILQCLAPLIAAVYLWARQRDAFGVAFCLAWLGTNFYHCATYCSDARGQLNLILVSPGGQAFGADGVGDWSRMLGMLGILEWDTKIAALLRLSGLVSMVAGIALGAWICWTMHRLRDAPRAVAAPSRAPVVSVRPRPPEPKPPEPQPEPRRDDGPPPLERRRRPQA